MASNAKLNRLINTPVSRKAKGLGPRPQSSQKVINNEEIDKEFYDPDQNPVERRAIRKKLRDLGRELNGEFTFFLHAIFRTIFLDHLLAY